MNDLIRKSDVLHLLYEIFNKYRMSTDKTNSICNSFGNEVFEEIRNMPTAYDIDKVVKELEEVHNKFCNSVICKSMCGDCVEYIMFNKNIEIVKHGGVSDDVCEWETKYINDKYSYLTSCGNIFIYETNSVYCPYCGKKIKVVE